MNKFLITSTIMLFTIKLIAQDISGVYAYNKGMNKANGNLYIMQFKPDSAFFYLNTLSGMPDFFTTDIKGYLRIDSNVAYIKEASSCRLELLFTKSSVVIHQDTACKYEYTTAGTYKKTSAIPKRNSTMLLNFTEKPAKSLNDSLIVFNAPSLHAQSKMIHCKEGDLKVIDDFNSFFLVEHKKYKTEFMWVPKKNLLIPKK